MIETLKSYLSKENYYIIITKNNIYLYNYEELASLNNNEILIKLNKTYYKIIGNNFSLNKIDKKELIINGYIESIKQYD